MSFSGGVYTLPGPALNTGEIVSASENNTFRNDVATAFNLTFLRNGTSTATANLPMGGYKLTGLGVATTSGDALSYGQAATVSTLTATGAAALNGGITVDSTAFTVADTTGNTSIAGTLDVTGVTTLTANPVLSGGTANGVAYLNGSKVMTTGSGLVFDGTNLGIGTSSPSGKLDVTGSNGKFYVAATGNEAYFSFNSGNYFRANGGSSAFLDIGGQSYLRFTTGSGFAEAMRIDSSGNVGIGTSSPASTVGFARVVNVEGTSSSFKASVTGASNVAEFAMSTNGAWLGTYYADPVRFYTNNTERMRIDSSGNVGIGTSSPGYKFDVQSATGNIAVTSTTGTNYCAIRAVNTGGTSYFGRDSSLGNAFGTAAYATVVWSEGAYPMAFGTNNTERMRIDSSGNVGIGTTGATRLLQVQGTFYGSSTMQVPSIGNGTGTAMVIDGSGFFRASTSSRRYKENIEPIDVGLAEVLQMEPVKYDLKENGFAQVGFIAEDFPEPRLVNYSMVDPEDPSKGEQVESVNYANLTAILVKAIQELKAELDATKAEVAALKGA